MVLDNIHMSANDPKPQILCPKGHPIGTRFSKQQCGKKKCGEDAQAELALRVEPLDLDALAKLTPAEQSFEQRAFHAQMPKGLTGEKATEWAQRKLVDLLPEAVARVSYDLRYGTDKEQREASDKVLRANGLDKREAQGSAGQGLIVLNLGAAIADVPWLNRIPKGDK